jgi:FkbM family methyltransferase
MADPRRSARDDPEAPMTPIGRSLATYYGDADRTARMDALNAAFAGPGARVFDIGAHVGDRTGSFLRLGASVVALEPQPRVFRALRLIYGRCPRATLLPLAVGATEGETRLHLNSANPTVATAAPDFIVAAADAPDWQGEVWDDHVTVPVTTLDALIARHGPPDFVKIDVEGHEPAVLAGLGHAVPALSFEFTTIQRAAAERCVARLTTLGRYEFDLSLGEDHRLRHDAWLGPEAVCAALAALPDSANSGDVYARLL